eukprot:1361024-Amorphochlora_amoeboformis.AAC.2
MFEIGTCGGRSGPAKEERVGSSGHQSSSTHTLVYRRPNPNPSTHSLFSSTNLEPARQFMRVTEVRRVLASSSTEYPRASLGIPPP